MITDIKINLNDVEIQGNNSSIWGPSDVHCVINHCDVSNYHRDDDNNEITGNFQLYGTNTVWHHYTDRQIEEQVKTNKVIQAAIGAAIQDKESVKIKKFNYICWSEQGMQPEKGWDFDFEIQFA